MTTNEEIGERIRDARLTAGLSVVQAAKRANVARDTWSKIEAGESVLDVKRRAAMDSLGVSADTPEPVTAETLDARLANLDRQVDALWHRLEKLEGQSEVAPSIPIQIAKSGPRSLPEVPAVPEDVAADDVGEPSRGEQVRQEQDEAHDVDQDADR